MMIEINLLPWRAAFRARQKRRFIIALTVTCGLALFILLSIHFFIYWQINITHTHTQRMEPHVAELQQHSQQKKYYRQQQHLLKHIYAAQIATATLFNTINQAIPSSVYLTEISSSNNVLTLRGTANSSTAIVDFFKNLQQSQQFADLQIIDSSKAEGNDRLVFHLQAKQLAEKKIL